MASEQKSFTIEGTRILFPNFSGKVVRYNTTGEKNFCVVVPDEAVADLEALGFNIKYLKPYEDDEDGRPTAYIKVKVSFKIRPPRIVMMTEKARTSLDEDTMGVLDFADIASVDIICNGSDWSQPDGKFGTSAYLKTLFVIINEDALERKYDINAVDTIDHD